VRLERTGTKDCSPKHHFLVLKSFKGRGCCGAHFPARQSRDVSTSRGPSWRPNGPTHTYIVWFLKNYFVASKFDEAFPAARDSSQSPLARNRTSYFSGPTLGRDALSSSSDYRTTISSACLLNAASSYDPSYSLFAIAVATPPSFAPSREALSPLPTPAFSNAAIPRSLVIARTAARAASLAAWAGLYPAVLACAFACNAADSSSVGLVACPSSQSAASLPRRSDRA